jgi:two-component system, OmpR family, sensor histidine kinase MprB
VSLRRRLMLMSAIAVGVTVALASLVCYLAMRSELRAQVDRSLRAPGELV